VEDARRQNRYEKTRALNGRRQNEEACLCKRPKPTKIITPTQICAYSFKLISSLYLEEH
jgi:hypothetical protein